MKRTPRNWWDQRAQKNQYAHTQLDVFSMIRRYLPAEKPQRATAPMFRSAAFGGSARRVKAWAPLAVAA